MTEPTPRLSVAMPVYNGGADLRLAVASVLAQSFGDWELLLIDDGSTDGAIEALRLEDSRVRVIRDGGNRGLAARLNQAIGLARGELLVRMDADDISHPERFARQVAFLDAHPEVDLLGTAAVVIDADGRVTGRFPFAATHAEICAQPWRGFHLAHPTWMGRTAWFRTHRYAEPAPYYCEDQELLLRTHATSGFAGLPDALFAYRVRGRLPWKKLFRARIALFRVQAEHFLRRGRIDGLILAWAATKLRVAMDAWRAVRGGAPVTPPVGQADRDYWEAYISHLATRPAPR